MHESIRGHLESLQEAANLMDTEAFHQQTQFTGDRRAQVGQEKALNMLKR